MCVALTGAKCRGWDRGSWVIGVAAEAEMAAPVVPFCWECCCTAAARACWRNSCCCIGAMVNWGEGRTRRIQMKQKVSARFYTHFSGVDKKIFPDLVKSTAATYCGIEAMRGK